LEFESLLFVGDKHLFVPDGFGLWGSHVGGQVVFVGVVKLSAFGDDLADDYLTAASLEITVAIKGVYASVRITLAV
jgi:hypothetical protein